MSNLEQDFDKAVENINAKLKQAAELIKEANLLGKAAGIEYLGASYYHMEDMNKKDLEKIRLIDYEPVLNQLDESGWRTSSLKC